jgi:hypothetical protein
MDWKPEKGGGGNDQSNERIRRWYQGDDAKESEFPDLRTKPEGPRGPGRFRLGHVGANKEEFDRSVLDRLRSDRDSLVPSLRDPFISALLRNVRKASSPDMSDHPEQRASVIVDRAFASQDAKRYKEALHDCEEVVRRFGSSGKPDLQKQVARAWVCKGNVMMQLGRDGEAIDTRSASIAGSSRGARGL